MTDAFPLDVLGIRRIIGITRAMLLKHSLLSLLLFILFCSLPASANAEIRTIAATGEYRMGDNDTRTDAKRMALQDAKRLALEQAGTYIESLTEVKNFALSNEEVRAYTAGIVEVTEHEVRSTMEGQQQIVRVAVTCKIDTDVVARQIDVLRQNEAAKAELLNAKLEAERLRQELDAKTHELASLKSKGEVEAIVQARRKVLTARDMNSLLAHAWVALAGSSETLSVGASSSEGRLRARRLIEHAMELDASSPSVHRLMGTLLSEEGNLEGAITEFRTALSLKPDDVEAHIGIGATLAIKGDIDGAIAEYRAALRLKPDHVTAHYNLGLELRNKGDIDGAIAEYRAALRLKPDSAEAHDNLGIALARKGNLDDAIAEHRIALRLKPDFAEAHNNLGNALKAKGDIDGAIAEYRAALRLKPDSAEAHDNLGNALGAKGDLAGAITEHRVAVRLKPDDATAHYNLGIALARKGNLDDAIVEFHSSIRLKPDLAAAHYNLGIMLGKKRQRASAAQEFCEYLRLTPDTPVNHQAIEKAKSMLNKLGNSSGC